MSINKTISNQFALTVSSFSLCALAIFFLTSCGSSDVTKVLTAEERFEAGKQHFAEEDYLEAIHEFEIVKLQYGGSAVADDAQFYLGECRLMREEYLLGIEEFQSLVRGMSASVLVPAARYKIGLCYYLLSPRSTLDQQYTLHAIDEFQSFIEYYPADSLVGSADEKIREMNARLAQKDFETAELYKTLEYPGASLYYFNSVLEKYHDSRFAEPALLGKINVLIGKKQYNDARKEIGKFLEKYPRSESRGAVEGLRQEVETKLKEKSAMGAAGEQVGGARK